MPIFEPSSRCYRHLKRTMTNFFSMSADELRTCIELVETNENADNSDDVGSHSSPVLLDCRSFVQYNSGHILDAINVHCPAILRRRSGGYLPLRTVVPNTKVRQMLCNGGNHSVILYDDLGTIPVKSPNAVSNEQLSTVEFVAKCLHNEAGLKNVFFLGGGYENFARSFPHLCTCCSSGLIAAGLCSPPVLSCPLLSRSSSLVSNPLRQQQQTTSKSIFDVGPVEILPHLYLGSAGDASRPHILKELDITFLLNVSRSGTCPEDSLGRLKGLKYKSIPLKDTSCQVIDCFFQEAFDFIADAEHSGSKVLVHCRAGISRSAAICIAYLMWRKRWRMEEAYEYVKSRRRTVSPNLNFMGQLLSFERKLFDSNKFNSSQSLTSGPTNIFDFRNISPNKEF